MAAANGESPHSDFDKARAAVDGDKTNFDSWAALLAVAESEDIAKVRATFDEFLERFPNCYGYWEKYAAAERRVGDAAGATAEQKAASQAASVAVYERAVAAVGSSPDMWLYYCNSVTEANADDKAAVESVFTRALDLVKLDPRSLDLWRAYIKYLVGKDDVVGVLRAYKGALVVPQSYADTLLPEFEAFVASKPTTALVTPEQRAAIEASIEGFSAKLTTEQDEAVRGAIVSSAKAKYEELKAERAARAPFENTLAARWYFHVTPVDVAQQGTWRRYLEWAVKQSPLTARNLYERCVIVCARYPEFWLRFAKFERIHGTNDASIAVLQRALKAVGDDQPRPRLALAMAFERGRRVEDARETYTQLASSLSSPLMEAVMNHGNFERRHGNIEAAAAVFQKALESTSGESYTYLAVQLGRLHALHGSAADARAVFKAAEAKSGAKKSFWEAFADAELCMEREGRDARVMRVYCTALGVALPSGDSDAGGAAATNGDAGADESKGEGAQSSPLSLADQRKLWTRFVNFVENHVADLSQVDWVHAKHEAWQKGPGLVAGAASTKRAAPGAVWTPDAVKKQRVMPAVAPVAAAGYYPPQAYAGYAAPQAGAAAYAAPQAAYGAQAAYGQAAYGAAQGYGAYAGYAQQR